MYACLYIPDFPVEAVLRATPELREQAIAVVQGTPPIVHVIACNERARQAGVETGMTKMQAEERVGKNGIRKRAPAQEQAAHAALLDCAQAFSPRVEDTASDMVMVDIRGLERVFGAPAKIARDLARRAGEMGLEVNAAVAANPDAAMLAARGFAGVTFIPEGSESERLGTLPVDVLQSTPELVETFDRWGIRNLRGLAALPEVAISERLGQDGLRLQRLARGKLSRTLVATQPELHFQEAMELEYPVELLEPLAFLLSRMLEQLCARLAARALATSELRLRLELDLAGIEDCRIAGFPDCRIEDEIADAGASANLKSEIANHKFHDRRLHLPVPMLDARVFLKLLQLDLRAHPPAAPIEKIWLEAMPAEPRRTQNGLFLPLSPETEKLELTLAKIEATIQRQNSPPSHRGTEDLRFTNCDLRIQSQPVKDDTKKRVGAAALLDTHRPDAFRVKRFAPSPARDEKTVCSGKRTLPATAIRMFRPPLRVGMELSGGKPVRFTCAERPTLRGDVVWCAGPWRASGDWWTDKAWAREEWDMAVRNEDGVAVYRAYRNDDGAWFLQGSYD